MADDFVEVGFQREVAAVDEVDLGVGVVATKGFGAGGQEERIIAPPHGERRRAMGAEIGLECRIQRDVAALVEEQIQLDLVIAGPVEQRLIEGVGLRRDDRGVGDAVGVLESGGLGGQQRAQGAACGIAVVV